MKDVRDRYQWMAIIEQFRKFAISQHCELDHKIMGDGREFLAVRSYYRPSGNKRKEMSEQDNL